MIGPAIRSCIVTSRSKSCLTQTLASLNHPNIAHIHGLEESGGVRALVMELVEGDAPIAWR